MNGRRLSARGAALACGLAAFCLGAAAVSADAPGIQVTPHFSFRQEYRSNIYLTAADTKSDLVSFFSPGLDFYLPVPGGELSLDYRADLLAYWSHSRNNTTRHALDFAGEWSGRQTVFRLGNRFAATDDPATSELTEREKRRRNAFSAGVAWSGARTGLEAEFVSLRDDYRRRDELDRTENYLVLTGLLRLRPRTDLLARYRGGRVDYDRAVPDRDASYHELTAGVRGRLSPKVTGELRAGFQKRDYSDPGRADFDGLVLFAGVTHQLNPRVETDLGLERGVQESTFGENSYYDYTKVNLGYRHLVGRRHLLKAGAGYERSSHPRAVGGFTRSDDTWNLALGWEYELRRWATLGADYRFRNRSSSYPSALHDYDYRDHTISVHCALVF